MARRLLFVATMTTIDMDLLATVTGGAGGRPQPQQQAPQQGDAQPQEGGGSGGFLAGLDGFLQFLQSPNFGKIVGGLQGILQQFMGAGGNGTSTGPSQASQQQEA